MSIDAQSCVIVVDCHKQNRLTWMQLPRQRQRHTHTHTRTCAYSCCGHYCVLLGLIVMNYASTMMRIIHTALASCSIARWLAWYRYTESNALLLVLVVCLLTLVLTFDHIGSELDQNYSSSRHLTLRPNRMSSNSLCWLPHHRHIMKSVLVVVVAVVVVVHGLIVKGTCQPHTKSALSRRPLTIPPINAAQFNPANSFGNEMYRLTIGCCSTSISDITSNNKHSRQLTRIQ
jgi:hypothetical protein